MKSFKIQETITSRESHALKSYFNELKSISILTTEEEYELAYAAFQGDEKARAELVKHNLRFVISVAKQYETKSLKLEDLINEGNVGLVTASNKFDPSRGFKFLSYAVWWIRRDILAYIADNGKTIRLPNNKINIITKIKDEFTKLEQKLQRQPCYDELLAELDGKFKKEDVSFYFYSTNNYMASLDAQVGNDDYRSSSLSDIIEDENAIKASYYVDNTDREYRQNRILTLLDKDLEREVIRLSFGLDGQSPLPLKTIGFLLGITSERVRQIKEYSLIQLKSKLVR
jgi:RNA polymerase primary sigma factor